MNHAHAMFSADAAAAGSAACDVVVLAVAQRVAAWMQAPGRRAECLPMHGEDSLPVADSDTLAAAYADLQERLRGRGVQVRQWHCVADAWGRAQPVLPWQSEGVGDAPCAPCQTPWQVLAWEWVASRWGVHEQPWAVLDRVRNEMLPWLLISDQSEEHRQMQAVLASEHEDAVGRLAAERARLRDENQALKARNAALQQVDAEQLVRFLPALYAQVFTVLGAADLALLCGRVEPLQIPNPYPEPSPEALRMLQKQFRLLSAGLQQQVVGFVAGLPQRQRLQVRPEMRELVHDLEQATSGGIA